MLDAVMMRMEVFFGDPTSALYTARPPGLSPDALTPLGKDLMALSHKTCMSDPVCRSCPKANNIQGVRSAVEVHSLRLLPEDYLEQTNPDQRDIR